MAAAATGAAVSLPVIRSSPWFTETVSCRSACASAECDFRSVLLGNRFVAHSSRHRPASMGIRHRSAAFCAVPLSKLQDLVVVVPRIRIPDSEFLQLRARRSGATRRDIPPLGHWDRPKSSPRTAQRSQQEPRPERLQKGHARITAGIGWRGLGIGDCETRNWESGRVASGIRQADWQSKDKELQGRRMKEARTNSRGNHVALQGAFESAAALRAKFTVARPQMFEGNLLPLNIKYFAINILQTTICGMKLKCITY